MSGHLSAQRIERYHQGELAPAELLTVGDHLATCADCRERMGSANNLRKAFVALGSDLETAAEHDPAHLGPEQMTAYVDNQLDDEDRSIADVHLGFCEECRAELLDLRGFKMSLSTGAGEAVPSALPVRRSGLAASWRPAARWLPQTAATLLMGKGVSRPAAGSRELKPRYSWLALASIAAALILGVSAIIWLQLDQPAIDMPPAPQVELPPVPPPELRETTPTPNPDEKQAPRTLAIAEARWNYDPDAISNAIRIERRRGDIPAVRITRADTELLTAVPRANAQGEVYRRYRIILVAGENPVWRRILSKPAGDVSDRASVLKVALSPRMFPKADSYELRFEGESQSGWEALGRVALQPVGK